VAAQLPEEGTGKRQFEDVVKNAEQAAGLVFVSRIRKPGRQDRRRLAKSWRAESCRRELGTIILPAMILPSLFGAFLFLDSGIPY
jgi:hypothetical protein